MITWFDKIIYNKLCQCHTISLLYLITWTTIGVTNTTIYRVTKTTSTSIWWSWINTITWSCRNTSPTTYSTADPIQPGTPTAIYYNNTLIRHLQYVMITGVWNNMGFVLQFAFRVFTAPPYSRVLDY